MTVTSALQTEDWLLLSIDGKEALTDTKFGLLHAGVATLHDAKAGGHYWQDAVAAVADGILINGATDDPVVAVLARRYFDAKRSDDFQAGPVPIPALGEAEQELHQAWGADLMLRG